MKNFIWKLIGVWCFMLVLGNAYSQSFTVDDGKCVGEITTFTVFFDLTQPVLSSKTSVQLDYGDGNTKNFETTLGATSATDTHVYWKGLTTGKSYTAAVTITYDNSVQQSRTVSVSVLKGPDVSFNYGKNEGACVGGTVILEVNTYGKNYVLFSNGNTYDGKSLVRIPVTTAGLYKAIAFDDNLCQSPIDGQNINDDGVVTVSFFENPEIAELTTAERVTGEITLSQKANPYSESVSYEWATLDGGSVQKVSDNKFYVEKAGTYTVTATQVHKLSTTDATCKATKSFIIASNGDQSTRFDAYNTFVPNSSGASATWTLKTKENITWYQDCKLTIYNSWGQVVYVKEKIGTDVNLWYGTTGDNGTGKVLPTDTYYYIVKCPKCSEPHTGSVTIIRK